MSKKAYILAYVFWTTLGISSIIFFMYDLAFSINMMDFELQRC